MGTADSEVHIVHLSPVISLYIWIIIFPHIDKPKKIKKETQKRWGHPLSWLVIGDGSPIRIHVITPNMSVNINVKYIPSQVSHPMLCRKYMLIYPCEADQWAICRHIIACTRTIARLNSILSDTSYCPACRTSLIATGFWVVMICPIIKCLTVLEFYFILFDLCLFITIFNFILNFVPIVTFWILTYHKIWILLIIFCFIWSYWIIYFLTCLEVFWSVVS